MDQKKNLLSPLEGMGGGGGGGESEENPPLLQFQGYTYSVPG